MEFTTSSFKMESELMQSVELLCEAYYFRPNVK